jgi:hypothetical protein
MRSHASWGELSHSPWLWLLLQHLKRSFTKCAEGQLRADCVGLKPAVRPGGSVATAATVGSVQAAPAGDASSVAACKETAVAWSWEESLTCSTHHSL